MAKSITAMLIGIAVGDGAIKSVDDVTGNYVPGFAARNMARRRSATLLHMSSGVDFGEERLGGRDLNRLWIDMVLGIGPTTGGAVSFPT